MTFLQLSFGYILGRIGVSLWLLPQYYRGQCFSAYELLRTQFSPLLQRSASGIFLWTRTIADGLRLFLTALLLHQFTGWNIQISILVMGLATLVYTILGGMQAVIWTDLIQLIIYLAGALITAVFIVSMLPGGLASYVQIGSAAGKFQVFDFAPTLGKPYVFWAGLIGGAFFSMASHGADQIMVQRYLCARSLGQAQLALMASGVMVLAQFLLFLLIGVGLFAIYHIGAFHVPEGTRNDEVFGRFIVTHLPQGLIGLIIAAVLAAAMSTLSSSLNSSATATLADFYRPIRPDRSESHYLNVSRGLTLLWGIAQVSVALIADAIQSQRSVVDQVLSIAGFTTGILLGLFLLGMRGERVPSNAAMIGLFAGIIAVTGLWLPSLWGTTLLAWPWFAPVGALTTYSVGVVAHWVQPQR